jgi:hypothetical protein
MRRFARVVVVCGVIVVLVGTMTSAQAGRLFK